MYKVGKLNTGMVLNKKLLGLFSLLTSGAIATIIAFSKGNDNLVNPIENEYLSQKISSVKGESIASKLSKQNIKLLGSLNDDFQKWQVMMEKYVRLASTKNLLITLDGEKMPRWNNLNIEQLSEWCKERSNESYEKEKILNQVKEFCSSPKNRDYLENKGKALLKDQTAWGNAVQKYTREVKTSRIPISELGTNIVDPNLLKNWCEGNIDNEYEEQKFKWILNTCVE